MWFPPAKTVYVKKEALPGDLGPDVPHGPSLRMETYDTISCVGSTRKGRPFPGPCFLFLQQNLPKANFHLPLETSD